MKMSMKMSLRETLLTCGYMLIAGVSVPPSVLLDVAFGASKTNPRERT